MPSNTMQTLLNSKRAGLMLLGVIAIIVLFLQNQLIGFGQAHNGSLSSHGMALAKNLSAEHNYLMFDRIQVDETGQLEYAPYNRFPITSFLLIKWTTHFAKGDLAKEVYLARQLMNLFFIGAMFLLYLSLYAMTSKTLIALPVALLSFSGLYLNRYHDMIFNDIPTLFGVLLVFHGMVIYTLRAKKGQLYLKSLIGVSLGWQVYALIIPFAMYGLYQSWKNDHVILPLFKSIYVKLTGITIIFGLLFLASNFIQEKTATGQAFNELPSVVSMKKRIGAEKLWTEAQERRIELPRYTIRQIIRMAKMIAPYLIEYPLDQKSSGFASILAIVAIIFFSLLLIYFFIRGWRTVPHKNLIVLLFISSLVWAYPMRAFVAFHDFQSIFLIGAPVILLFPAVYYLYQQGANWVKYVLIFAACGFFLSGQYLYNQIRNKEAVELNVYTQDFQKILNVVPEKTNIYMDGIYRRIAGGRRSAEYYLSGRYFSDLTVAKYVISNNPHYNECGLTPKNLKVYAYLAVCSRFN